MSEVTSVPTSKIKRGAITGVAAAKVGIKHFSHKTRYFLSKEINKKQSKEKHQEELSDLIFSVLCQLRGTALKFSQLLSMEAGIFTKSIRDKFRGACHGIVPIDRELVRQQIFKELGNSPAQLFRSFNSSAFAAASIGQVHRAIHDNGDLLAVKVQYPGIEIAIASDLKLVEKIIWLLSKSSHLLPEKKVVDLLLEEMTERLKEEIDYEIEAGHLRWFRKSIKLECVVIPRVIDELTAKRVITLEFIEGKKLDEWLASEPSQQERNNYGQKLFDFFWYSVINLHKINADVHPGNFLILPDGEMAVLDFGCVRELSEQFVDGYQKSMIDMNDVFFHNNSSQRLFESYKKLQITDKEICSQQFEEKIMPTLRSCYTWLGEIYVEKKFDFKHKKPYPDEAMRTGWAILKRLNGLYSEQFCFDRAHLGLICLLTEIGAEINTDFTRLKCS